MMDVLKTEAEVRAHVGALFLQLAPDDPDPDRSGPAGLIDDLGYHSLALLELAFAVEDDFDLPPIDEETGRGLVSDDDVITYVIGQLETLDQIAPPLTGEDNGN